MLDGTWGFFHAHQISFPGLVSIPTAHQKLADEQVGCEDANL